MLGKNTIILASLALVASCTGPLNDGSVKSKPTDYLCRLLGPDYLTLPSEQEAIYRELENREAQCMASQRVIVENR